MNKENAHLFLPLVQALVDGKTIQIKNDSVETECWQDFEDVDQIQFCEDPSCYRIKPEPRTWGIYVRPSGKIVDGYDYSHVKRQGYERITVQEVLE